MFVRSSLKQITSQRCARGMECSPLQGIGTGSELSGSGLAQRDNGENGEAMDLVLVPMNTL